LVFARDVVVSVGISNRTVTVIVIGLRANAPLGVMMVMTYAVERVPELARVLGRLPPLRGRRRCRPQ